ncbi:hypothetical protein MTR_2g065985 [Medicago truncatula]|uniref:Nodule Cysteine-Rich (NCR) secreted peptide n=1 Tax=Medicago truncatula TaxID=3880 RepID=G7IQX4_MEDTR|nr:hypothetical protein MTR_2g065985 [Medicago truncatula]
MKKWTSLKAYRWGKASKTTHTSFSLEHGVNRPCIIANDCPDSMCTFPEYPICYRGFCYCV